MYGWTLQAYLYTLRSCSQKGNWNEFVDRFKLLPIGIQELILQKIHGKKIVWSLQNYILYINGAKLYQYRKWLPIIVYVLILTKVDKLTLTNHIVSMRDEKKYLKPNINELIKWWIPFVLLQLRCRWIEEFTTYSYGNELYYFKKLITNERQLPLLL